MESKEQLVANAWRIAAAELGIEVQTDISLTDENDCAHRFVVHVAGFGGPRGTICSLTESADNESGTLDGLAHESGYYYSQLGEGYAAYDRTLFVATLDDRQWFRADKPAPWYTGTPWTRRARDPR
jgi:hypothetical protein